MTGSCDDCDRMLTWEERYDFEGHGGEMMSECGLPDDLWTDELAELGLVQTVREHPGQSGARLLRQLTPEGHRVAKKLLALFEEMES